MCIFHFFQDYDIASPPPQGSQETNRGVAGSVNEEDLPEFPDELDLASNDEENPIVEDDEADGEELFGDNMEA